MTAAYEEAIREALHWGEVARGLLLDLLGLDKKTVGSSRRSLPKIRARFVPIEAGPVEPLIELVVRLTPWRNEDEGGGVRSS